jgi:hypothetical protein
MAALAVLKCNNDPSTGSPVRLPQIEMLHPVIAERNDAGDERMNVGLAGAADATAVSLSPRSGSGRRQRRT